MVCLKLYCILYSSNDISSSYFQISIFHHPVVSWSLHYSVGLVVGLDSTLIVDRSDLQKGE